jgi:predicted RecA/RadA family phage recombinase
MSNVIHKAGMKEPVMADHTPSSAVLAGAVVVIGNNPRIAHRDIAANELGALAIFGGIYEVTAAGAYTDGAKVYWDPVANKVTTTAGSLKVFGELVTASSGDGGRCLMFHNPGAL